MMISKTLYKQSLKSNIKIWLIFTAILSVLSSVTICTYDPQLIQSMMDTLKNSSFGSAFSSQMGSMTTLTGMLGQQFYNMMGIILPMVFIIITANSLIASQVDRGSMAYVLSTPIKRTKVVTTQAFYLVTAIFCMFLVVTIVGLTSVQLSHSGLWGTQYTKDVTAASSVLNASKQDVSNDLTLILNNQDALKKGASARNIDVDTYSVYLNMKMSDNAYTAAAKVLGTTNADVTANPKVIESNQAALEAAAKAIGMTADQYKAYLNTVLAQTMPADQANAYQNKIITGVTAAAKVLNVDVSNINMEDVKTNNAALTAAVNASGIPQAQFVQVINAKLASDQISLDKGLDFSVWIYLKLNIGCFLLMFAIAGISFFFSCLFNLGKNSIALGAGIPLAFFVFQIMSQIGSSLANFKYVSLITLFDTKALTSGGNFILNFIVLAVVGILLYAAGITVFKKKDLPL